MINLDPLKTNKKKMISLFTVVTSVFLLAFSSSPPLGKTGAPGDGLCSECHSSVPDFNGSLAISGIPATVVPETTYPISVIITRENASALKAGFQLVALNGNHLNVGTLNTPGSNVGFASSGIRNYAQHQNAKSFASGSDVITYNFNWTSPSIAGNNNITFYASSVLANGNGSSFNDRVLTQSTTAEFIGPQGDPLEVIISNVQNADCAGAATGSATAIATGGISPYIYNWSNGGTTASISNIAAGTYTVTVSDQLGESTSASVTITQPGAIQLQQVFAEDITCSNPVAQINVSATGGTGAIQYSWSNGASGNEISVTTGGNYTVTATDANNCTSSLTVFIFANNEDPIISAGNDQTIFCAGQTIQLQGSGPIDPEVTISWMTNSGNILSGADTYTPSVNQAGEYYLVVLDNFTGCSSVDTVLVFGDPSPITVNGSVTNVSCNGGNNGGISISVSGGSGTYSYIWSNSATSQFPGNLVAGTYGVTVSDAFGCTGTSSFVVTQPAILIVNTSSTPISSPGENDATITASASGGTSPYTYAWSNSASGPVISDLGPGTYTVTATDNAGCTATKSVIISPFNCNLQIDSITITHQICPGIPDASIEVFTSGGTAPVTYNWSGAVQGNVLEDVLPGIYYLTVLDSQGCAVLDTIIVNASDLSLIIDGVAPSAPGMSDGSVAAIITGGTSPYSYLWNTGDTTLVVTALPAAVYSVTITDANGCELSASINLNISGCDLDLEIVSISNESCSGNGDGAISVLASGGSQPYAYSWSNGESTNIITGLSAGIYIVTATDDAGCSVVDTIEVGLNFYFELEVTPVSTEGNNDGSITVNIIGGIDPITIIWSNGETTATINDLFEGEYTVTVTNGNGCAGSLSVNVGVAGCDLEIELIVQESILCFGSTGLLALNFITEGTAPYTYNISWTPGINHSEYEVPAGFYSVTVIDARGCSSADSVLITQPEEILYDVVAFTPQISQEGTGAIHLDISGGIGNYSIVWLYDGEPFSQTSNEITSLNSGVYQAEITDENNCTIFTEEFEILLETSSSEKKIEFPFILYPNPVAENLFLDGDWKNVNLISITDISGRVIHSQINITPHGIQTIQVSHLPSGFYTLSIHTEQVMYNSRFIKQ